MEISACASRHPVEGLCYRFTDRCAGKVLGLTGDTFYDPKIREFLSGCDTLVHEAALADSETDQENPPRACTRTSASRSPARRRPARRSFSSYTSRKTRRWRSKTKRKSSASAPRIRSCFANTKSETPEKSYLTTDCQIFRRSVVICLL